MEIIKHGSFYNRIFECQYCGCQMKLSAKDFDKSAYGYIFLCPECGESLLVTQQQRQTIENSEKLEQEGTLDTWNM